VSFVIIVTFLACGLASLGLLTLTASWHRALQMCPHLLVSLGRPHTWPHGGQSPLWQRCLMAWWHLGVMLQEVRLKVGHYILRKKYEPTEFQADNACTSFPATRNTFFGLSTAAVNLGFQFTRIARSVVAHGLTFVLVAAQLLATNLFARWTLVPTAL